MITDNRQLLCYCKLNCATDKNLDTAFCLNLACHSYLCTRSTRFSIWGISIFRPTVPGGPTNEVHYYGGCGMRSGFIVIPKVGTGATTRLYI